VLFVCSSLAGGGAERFVSTALGELDRARLEPSLCLLDREIAYPLADDVPCFDLDKRRPRHLPRSILRLARLLDRLRPAVAMSAFSYPSFVLGNALWLARHRPGWVARVSSSPDLSEAGLLRPWMGALYRRADVVLANSDALRRRFDATYPRVGRAARRLPNAVDFPRIERLAAEAVPPPPAARARLVSVGRLERVKRFDLLIDALARLAAQADVELVICGRGPERGRLESLARRLGVADRVHLPGFLANPYPWIASAELFALSSDSEGLPNALIEAQGLGVTAVATDCDFGPREIVEHGATGLLVPPGDAEALAAALAELLRDAPRRRAFGEAARRRALAQFAAGPVTRRLEEILLEVARTPSRTA
jgi:N-acetylgalactosamine-N,N'-diacetylbacillosaminyl-diphospho-undecaprenol 4-alpha-N-acetylgalactosaminyltransferase